MTLEELLDYIAKFARQAFNKQGELFPMWIGFTATGEQYVIPTPWRNNTEKDVAAFKLRRFFQEKNVVRYAFICEAWTLLTDDPDIMQKINSVAEHPDRIEVVNVIVADKNREIGGMYRIIREGKKVSLGEFEKSPIDNASIGRMSQLLSTAQ